MLEKEVLAYREEHAHQASERRVKYSNEIAASASSENDQKSFPNVPIKTLQRETGKTVSSNVVVDVGKKFSSYNSNKGQNTDADGDKMSASSSSSSRYGADSATSLSTAKIPSHAQSTEVNPSSFAGALKEGAAAGVTSTEKAEKEKLERVEKTIDVPSTLVGLLLSRGPQPNAVAVINQVQRLTSTFISKIPSPKYTGKKSAIVEPTVSVVVPAAEQVVAAKDDAVEVNPKVKRTSTRRRRSTASSSDDDADEDDEENEEEDDEDDDDDEEAVDKGEEAGVVDDIPGAETLPNEEDDKETNHAETPAATVVTAAVDEVYPVTFRILSFAEANVDAAIVLLQRMIDGERIREVLDSGRISTRSLTHFGDRICELYSASAQPGGRPRIERPERRDKDSTDRPPASRKWNRDEAVERQRVPSTWSARPTDGKRKRSEHSKPDTDRQAERGGDRPPAEDENGRFARPSDGGGRRDRKERGRGGRPRERDNNPDREKEPYDASERKDEHGGNERRERGSRRGERKPRERDQEDSTANIKGEGTTTADRDRDRDGDRDRNPERRRDVGDREKRAPRPGRGGRDGGRDGGARGGRGGRRGGRGPSGADAEGGTAEKESAGDPL